MPGKVKVKIVAGRNLPVMDRSSDTTDAYVEIKLGNTTFKTDVCRKSLNPQWNSEWYRFEMDDAELQDEPLQIRIMDHDTYSANDSIGKVYLDLNPLLLPPQSATVKTAFSESGTSTNSLSGGNTMSGWFPVYDTMHGIRGEVNVIVKVELFSDFNKFRQSSCGVQFFNSSSIPQGYHANMVHGMVEELVVSNDPEHQWIEMIRTPRASNEARQTQFLKLSGEVQRKIGLKVLDLGGNAVIGYLQCFDLEAECGIVVRGLGTAVSLVRSQEPVHSLPCQYSEETVPEESAADLQPFNTKVSQSPIKLTSAPGIHRRSSDSDLSITPKGNSLTSSGDRSSVAGSGRYFQPICPKLALKKESVEALEFPFLTMNKFPPGFVVCIASTVSATSVKLLERITNLEEPESRDAWWMELRKEIRNHIRALSCNAVIGYSENTNICDDVCVLSAIGTAAVVNVRPLGIPTNSDTPEPPPSATIPLPPVKQLSNMASSLDQTDLEVTPVKVDSCGGKSRLPSESTEQPESTIPGCSLFHLPFKHSSLPFPITTIKCGICKKQLVPDVMLATVEPPDGISVVGHSALIHAFVVRPKQHARGEMNACVVSDMLPFIQFDVYKQLINKLRVNGMNAVFGLKIQICLGEKLMAGVASGTGVCLEALPIPQTPNVKHGGYESKDYATVMKTLQECVKRNRDFYQINQAKSAGTNLEAEKSAGGEASDTEDSDNEKPDLDLNAGNKDVGLIIVDDEQDIEEVNHLLDTHPPDGFFVTATENVPGLEDLEVVKNLQMFTQILRLKNGCNNQPPQPIHYNFDKVLQGVYYKMRRMTPCALGNFKIHFALPESDDIQICIVGMALGLNDKIKKSVRRRTVGASSKPEPGKKSDDGDLIFSLEEDQESSNAQTPKSAKPRSPARSKRQSTHMPPTDRYGVDITTLSYIPGGRIERYLGNLNFFFVRESSCIRESGGPSGFVHSFVAEVLAILRAHVTALGGNALASFFLNECVIISNPQKNHGQCLINVGGDVVSVSYMV